MQASWLARCGRGGLRLADVGAIRQALSPRPVDEDRMGTAAAVPLKARALPEPK